MRTAQLLTFLTSALICLSGCTVVQSWVGKSKSQSPIGVVLSPSLPPTTIAPVITLTSPHSGYYKPGDSVNITWVATDDDFTAAPITLEYTTNGGTTWTPIASNEPNDGTYTFTIPGTETELFKFRVTADDLSGNLTAAASSSNIIVDNTAPSISALNINNNGASTSNRLFDINFTASETQPTGKSNITHICLKPYRNGETAPTAPTNMSDPCWKSLASIGLTPANTITNLIAEDLLVPAYITDNYLVRGWVADRLGHISSSYQEDSIGYIQPTPGVIVNAQAGNTDALPYPVTSTEAQTTMGTSVYIKWKATAGTVPFEVNPVKIYYTQDNSNWTEIDTSTPKANGANGTCTTNADYNGCYVWTNTVTSSFIRFRVEVVDQSDSSIIAETPGLNTGAFRQLAGNVSLGIGGVASKATFLSYTGAASSEARTSHLAVTKTKIVYFYVAEQGIVQIKPGDGKVRLILKKSSSAPVDGSVGTATINSIGTSLLLDTQDRLLIFETTGVFKIRRFDPATDTVTTIAGGGGLTASGSLATSFNLANNGNCHLKERMFVDKDNNIYFLICITDRTIQNVRLAKYQSSDQRIYLTSITMTEGYSIFEPNPESYETGWNVANQLLDDWFIIFDSNGNFDRVVFKLAAYVPTVKYFQATFDSTGTVVPQSNAIKMASGTTGHYQSNHSGQVYGFLFHGYTYIRKMDLNNPNHWITLNYAPSGISADGTSLGSSNISINAWSLSSDNVFYFVERGKLRYVDGTGKIQSLYGEYTFAGDGGPRLEARFNTIPYIELAGSDGVLVVDDGSLLLRKINISANTVVRLAGNYTNDGRIDVTKTALNNSFYLLSQTVIYNPNDGLVYARREDSSHRTGLYKLLGTGYWSKVAFGGSGTAPTYYNYANSNSEGFNINNVIDNGYMAFTFMTAFSPERNSIFMNFAHFGVSYARVNSMLKEINLTSNTFHHVSGAPSSTDDSGDAPWTRNIGVSTFSADGTDVATAPYPHLNGEMTYQWDGANPVGNQGPRMLAVHDSNQKRLVGLPVGAGGTIQTVTTTIDNMRSFAYVRKAPNNVLYYCTRETTSRLKKRTITDDATGAGTEVVLTLPPGVTCSGSTLRWEPTRQSVVFPFLQNTLNAVAEYYDP